MSHTWLLCVSSVESRSRARIRPREIAITFLMPQHQHGLASEITVLEDADPSCVKVAGLRFHMPGWWKMILEWKGRSSSDLATLSVVVP